MRCPYGPDDFDSIVSRVIRTDKADPATQEEATAIWRVTVKDRDERKVGRAFADAMVHTALAGIPGMYGLGGGPGAGSPFGVYRPATIPSDLVPQYVHVAGQSTVQIDSVAPAGDPIDSHRRIDTDARPRRRPVRRSTARSARWSGTRSGDKGGDANLGVFVRTDDAWPWLDEILTVERLRELLPEAAASRRRAVPIPEDAFAQLRDPRAARGRRCRIDPPGCAGQGPRRMAPGPRGPDSRTPDRDLIANWARSAQDEFGEARQRRGRTRRRGTR